MEKYSKWRDLGTGIQPFVQPIPARTHQQGLVRLLDMLKTYALGPVLSTLRLAALGATIALELVTSTAGLLLVFSPTLRRAWLRPTRALWARLALFILGFHWIDTQTKRTQRPGSRRNTGHPARICNGDIIIATHSSYIDVLYLIFRYNPVFVALDNASARAVPISLWAALRAPALPTPALLSANDARPLSDVTREARAKQLGPVVVFPENCTGNGRALIQFLPVFAQPEAQDEKVALHLLAIKYPFKAFSPVYSVGSQMAHLLQLCCQLYNSASVRVLDSSETPKICDSLFFCEDREPVDLDDAVADAMIRLTRLRMTKLTAMDKRDFLAFYHKKAKSGRRAGAQPR